MKSWKVRLGLMLTMLAMLLAVAVPASAQELWAQYGPGECWVDVDGNTWCPWDPSLVAPVEVVEEDVDDDDEFVTDFESFEDELDDFADVVEDFEEFDEDFDGDLDAFFDDDDDCDDDDDGDCDDDDDDDDEFDFSFVDDEEEFEELFE